MIKSLTKLIKHVGKNYDEIHKSIAYIHETALNGIPFGNENSDDEINATANMLFCIIETLKDEYDESYKKQ